MLNDLGDTYEDCYVQVDSEETVLASNSVGLQSEGTHKEFAHVDLEEALHLDEPL